MINSSFFSAHFQSSYSILISPYNCCLSSLPSKIKLYTSSHFAKLLFSAFISFTRYIRIDLSNLLLFTKTININPPIFSKRTALYVGSVKLSDQQLIELSQKLTAQYLCVIHFNFNSLVPIASYSLFSVEPNFSIEASSFNFPFHSFVKTAIIGLFLSFLTFFKYLCSKNFSPDFTIKTLLSFPFYADKSFVNSFYISRLISTVFSKCTFSSLILAVEGEPYEFYLKSCLQKNLSYDSFNYYFPSPFFPLSYKFSGPLSHLMDNLNYAYIFIPSNLSLASLQAFLSCSSLVSINHHSLSTLAPRTVDFSNLLHCQKTEPFVFLILPEACIQEVSYLLSSVINYCNELGIRDVTLVLKPHPSTPLSSLLLLKKIVPAGHVLSIILSWSDVLDKSYSAICHSGSTSPMMFSNSLISFISFPSSYGHVRDCYSTKLYKVPFRNYSSTTFKIKS